MSEKQKKEKNITVKSYSPIINCEYCKKIQPIGGYYIQIKIDNKNELKSICSKCFENLVDNS